MPHSFDIVNKLSTKLFEQERRYVYTTPKSFLELIKLFKNMLETKRDNLLKDKDRYESGLVKLRETAEQVALIQEEVKVKQIEAEEKKKEADAFAEKVGIEKGNVEIENAKAEKEAAKCSEIKRDVEEKKSTTENRLEAAGPLVKQAQEALKGIEKKDFDTCKAFASPPQGIPEVFAATMFLLAGFYNEIELDKQKKPKNPDWKAAVKMMKNPKAFLQVLMDFKDIVNAGDVQAANVAHVKTVYL
jgi:dynein heavy chain